MKFTKNKTEMSIKRTKSKTKTKNECWKNKKQTKNQKRTLKKQKAKQRPKKKKQLLEKNNNLFPDFRSIYYFPLTLRQLRFSGIRYKQSACLLFNKIIQCKKVSFVFVQQKISKRCRLENWVLAYVISRERRAPKPKQFQSNVSQVKRSLHAKFSYVWALSKWPKNLGDVLACGLSITDNVFSNWVKY